MNELTPDEHKILVDAIHDSVTVVHKGRMMNERILKLAEQAGYVDKGSNHTAYINFDHEKFAELLIQECADFVRETYDHEAAESIAWNMEIKYGLHGDYA